MSEPRRYTDEEVRAIFRAAGSAAESADGPAGGRQGGDARSTDPTLAELTSIAREVGLDLGRVRDAALALDDDTSAAVAPPTDEPRGAARRPGALRPTRRTRLGAPLGVAAAVDLPRAPTDAEWQILVSEMRETFGARGKLSQAGSLRDWSNGNLHGAIEPTESGFRFRLSTLKGNAAAMETAGFAMAALGVVITILLVLNGDVGDAAGLGGFMLALAAFYLGSNAVLLPRWARERQAQFDALTDRARTLVGPAGSE